MNNNNFRFDAILFACQLERSPSFNLPWRIAYPRKYPRFPHFPPSYLSVRKAMLVPSIYLRVVRLMLSPGGVYPAAGLLFFLIRKSVEGEAEFPSGGKDANRSVAGC